MEGNGFVSYVSVIFSIIGDEPFGSPVKTSVLSVCISKQAKSLDSVKCVVLNIIISFPSLDVLFQVA